MCNLLNSHEKYINICNFTPERITEGGIVYNYKDNNTFYKSVRLCLRNSGKWYHIKDNVMTEWGNSNDIILEENNKITIFLKSFHGAPLFTIDELKIWEDIFNLIGLKRIGKYPSKKSLIS